MSQENEILQALKGERLPAVVVDLDAFDRNLEKMVNQAKKNGKKLRIATKSIRVPELILRALDFSPTVEGLMCYSAEEAVALSQKGFDNFLIAYPTLQEKQLLQLQKIHLEGKTVSIVVDQETSLLQISDIMKGQEGGVKPFPVVIELDVSTRMLFGSIHLGARRSPIREAADLIRLINKIKTLNGIQLKGVMAYEAQVAGLGDRNPFKPFINLIAYYLRRYSAKSVMNFRMDIHDLLRSEGISLDLFNGGGTGSIGFTAQEEVITELTVGSALLCPHLFDYYSNLNLEPACFFALEAVRKSDPRYITCQGGGYIASGEIGQDRAPIPVYPKGLELTQTEGCGEVQTPLKVTTDFPIALGSPIVFRHAKAGELAERFNDYLLVSKGKLISRAKTYRGLGWCFF
jgi:D-serine deaminase-like pyridoxal phosphate-dependent protein